MTPWVMRLIMANVLVFFFTSSQPMLVEQFALVPGQLAQHPWTAITYMFLHGSFGHIFFNMLSLWVFGPPLEARLGGRRFVTLYTLSGLAGALLSVATSPAAVIGASGATYGVMLGYAWFWPRQQLLLWGIVAVEARILVVAFTLISLFGAQRGGGGIAHFAHLGGFLGAWLYLRWLGNRPAAAAAAWQKQMAPRVSGSVPALERWKKIDAASLHPVNREEYDRVMAKLNSGSVADLTAGEREFLDRFSQAAG